MALPLLPAARCSEAVNIIIESVKTTFASKSMAAAQKKWLKFLMIYFNGECNAKVTPEVYSVFLENDRTNNYIVLSPNTKCNY